MIVGKAEINASGSFPISRQYWGNNLYGLGSEIINSPPAASNSLKRNPCCGSNCHGLIGHSEEFWLRYLHWQELVNVNYEQISLLRLLESNWTLFWRMFMTNQSYKRENSHQLSLWRRDGGQSNEDQNEQQQQQPANHSSDNRDFSNTMRSWGGGGHWQKVYSNEIMAD